MHSFYRSSFLSFLTLLASYLVLFISCLQADEEPYLQNIRQLTFGTMNFEKAGEAYFSPDDQTIIFQAVENDQERYKINGQERYQIYVMNLDEGVPYRVSTGKGTCTCAYFRPDGRKIIFASSHEDPALSIIEELNPDSYSTQTQQGKYHWDLTPYMNIYEANPDGTDLKALTTGPAYHAECAYSSDGSRIVYASNESGSMHIYTMKADGSDVQKITEGNDHCYHGGPFYSPNDQQIIFRADPDVPDHLQIYVINSDGTDERQLTFNDAVNWAPYWHPNGKVIAFATSIHGHHRYEIYLQNIETGRQERLTNHVGFDGLPVFSHDGTRLLWTSKRGPENACHLFVADFICPDTLQ